MMQQQEKKKTVWKRIAIGFAGLFFTIMLLPYLLSLSWVKNSALYCINYLITGVVSIDSLSLRWFGKQTIDGFYWQQGENAVRWKQFETDASLFRLFGGGSSSTETRFDTLHIALSAADIPTSFALPLSGITSGQLHLNDASFSLAEDNTILPIMKAVELHWLHPTNHTTVCQIQGITVQEKKEGKIHATIEYTKKPNRDPSTFFPHDSLQLHIEGERIPIKSCSPFIRRWNKAVAHWAPLVIGEGLSLTFDATMDAQTIETALVGSSSLAKLTIKGKCNEEAFILKEGSGQFTLLPEVSNRLKDFFPLLNAWHVQQPIPLSIRCNTLTLPLASWEGSLNEMLQAAACKGQIALEGVKWSHDSHDKSHPSLVFNRIQADWITEKESDVCTLSGKAEIKNKAQMPAALKFSTTLSSCFDDQNRFAWDRVMGKATASLTAFPLRLIDGMIQSKTWCQSLIGSTCSITAESEIIEGKAAVKASMESEYLRAPDIACFLSLQGVSVETPFAVHYRFPKKTLNLGLQWGVVSEDKVISALRCSHDLAWEWHIDRAWIPFSLDHSNQMVLHTRLQLSPFGIKHIPHVHQFATEPLALDVKIDTLKSIQFQGEGGFVSNPEGTVGVLLGEKGTLFLSGKAQVDDAGKVTVPQCSIHFDSDALHYQGTHQYEKNRHLVWSPLSLHYQLSPQRWNILSPWLDLSSWAMTDSCSIDLESQKGDYPLWEEEGWKKIKGKAAVAIDTITPTYQEKQYPTLQAIKGTVKRSKEEGLTSFSLQSDLLSQEETLGKISVEGQVMHDTPTTIQGKVKANQIAIALLEPFFNLSRSLVPLLGHTAKCTNDFLYNLSEKWMDCALSCSTDYMKAIGQYRFDGVQWETISPTEIKGQITPAAFDSVMQWQERSLQPFILQKPVAFSAILQSVLVPTKNPLDMHINGSFSLQKGALSHRENNAVLKWSQWTGSLYTEKDPLDHVNVSLQGQFSVQDDSGNEEAGEVKGEVQYAKQALQDHLYCNLQGQSCPVFWATDLFCIPWKAQIDALLGPRCSFQFSSAIEQGKGTLELTLDATEATGSIKGEVDNGALLLQEPSTLTCRITPAWNTAWFNRSSIVQPVPVSLLISPEGTFVPLFPLAWDTAIVGKTEATLGPFVSHSKNDNSIMRLFYPFLSFDSTVHCWCAPFVFTIDKGVLQLDRMDVLLNNDLHFIFWGKSSLLDHSLQLTGGMTTESVRKIVHDDNTAFPDGVLHTPVQGKWEKPDINVKKFAKVIQLLEEEEKKSTKKRTFPFPNLFEIVVALTDKPIEHYFITNNSIPERAFDLPWNHTTEDKDEPQTEQSNEAHPVE